MSFILDALRKSEHARQQSSGPGLAEVPIAAARPRTNVWAIAAIALLLVNLVGAGVLLLRRAHKEEAAAAATTSLPAASNAPVASGGATTSEATAPPATTQSAAPALAAAPATLPPSATGAAIPAASAASTSVARMEPGRNPLAEEVGDRVDPTLEASASSVPGGPPVVTSSRPTGTKRKGSVVYAPIPEASDLPYSPPAEASQPAPSRATIPAAQALPTADDLAARGTVPALHIDLHVYAASPSQRFVFVNSRKYREGDALQEGPVVEQITPDGAVLSFHGSRFKLTNN